MSASFEACSFLTWIHRSGVAYMLYFWTEVQNIMLGEAGRSTLLRVLVINRTVVFSDRSLVLRLLGTNTVISFNSSPDSSPTASTGTGREWWKEACSPMWHPS